MKQSMLSDYKGLNFVRENEYIPQIKKAKVLLKVWNMRWQTGRWHKLRRN